MKKLKLVGEEIILEKSMKRCDICGERTQCVTVQRFIVTEIRSEIALIARLSIWRDFKPSIFGRDKFVVADGQDKHEQILLEKTEKNQTADICGDCAGQVASLLKK